MTLFFEELRPEDPMQMEDYFHRIFAYLGEHEELYRHLLVCDEPIRFMETLRKKSTDVLLGIHPAGQDRTIQMSILFFSYGFIHLCIDYFQTKTDYTLDEIEHYCIHWLNHKGYLI